MQLHWINRDGNPRLLVFVLGWAADYRLVKHIRPEGFDILTVYDVREIEPLSLPDYEHKTLLAWSFGIWAAEQIFRTDGPSPVSGPGYARSFDRSIALCGSPLPMDDRYGLGAKRAALTLRSLPGGIDGFYRASMGTSYDRFASVLPLRDPDDLRQELSTLIELASVPYTPQIEWDDIIIGEQDTIFPQANLLDYWGGRAVKMALPHYPFADPDTVERWISR